MDKCHVKYSMFTKLHRKGKSIMKWTIKNSFNFTLFSPPAAMYDVPSHFEPIKRKVNTMCCYNRGNVAYGAIGSSKILKPGGHIDVKYAIKNLSTVPIKCFEIKLKEEVKWTPRNGRSGIHCTTLFKKRLESDPEKAAVDESDKLFCNVAALAELSGIDANSDDYIREIKTMLHTDNTNPKESLLQFQREVN